MKLKGIPIHICDKAPKDKPMLLDPKLFVNCPYCGKKLEETKND
jgi:hypothetical protein